MEKNSPIYTYLNKSVVALACFFVKLRLFFLLYNMHIDVILSPSSS